MNIAHCLSSLATHPTMRCNQTLLPFIPFNDASFLFNCEVYPKPHISSPHLLWLSSLPRDYLKIHPCPFVLPPPFFLYHSYIILKKDAMAPWRKNLCTAKQPAIPTICKLLPTRYHYKLQVTSNSQIHPGFLFTFGKPLEHLTQAISNPKLTKIHCNIMTAGHTFRERHYKGVDACMHCNITGTITWTDAKRHRAALKNIWLAPSFASQGDWTAKSKELMDRMTAFLNKAGEMYWREVTKWDVRI